MCKYVLHAQKYKQSVYTPESFVWFNGKTEVKPTETFVIASNDYIITYKIHQQRIGHVSSFFNQSWIKFRNLQRSPPREAWSGQMVLAMVALNQWQAYTISYFLS